MRLIQHYSGSKGNLYEVKGECGSLLIECGVPWKRLVRAAEYNFDNIRGCLVTHGHADHAMSIDSIARAGIDVYGMASTVMLGRRRHHLKIHHGTNIRDFVVYPFLVVHDYPDTVGFVIQEKKDWLFFATDCGFIEDQFEIPFGTVAIECSYDLAVVLKQVESGDMNKFHASRVQRTHMGKDEAKDYLRTCVDLSKCTALHLLHAGGTIDRHKVVTEFQQEFMAPTFIHTTTKGS